MDQRIRPGLLVLFVCVGMAFFESSAQAQTTLSDPGGSLVGLLDLIRANANGWAAHLRSYATRLFWMLAVIQFVWTFFPLVLRQADFGEIVGELVRFILVIGFFCALLLYSVEWATAVVESFRTAGSAASGLGRELRPGDIFGVAVDLAKMIGKTETWNPAVAAIVAIAGAIVLLCFAFIAAFMAVTLVESYIVINASVLFMGFGGGQWTREYSIAMARYAVAVGAKLFVLTLIVGLIVQSAHQWQAAYNHDDASMWTMVGLSLVCAYLSKQVPDLVQSLITGTSMGGGHALGGMAMAAAAVATAGVAAATAGAAGAGGAAGAAGSGGGSGGLAGLINSSLSGGGMARAATGLDGLASGANTLAPRTGGATSSASRMGGSPSPEAAPTSTAAKPAQEQDQGAQQQKQEATESGSVASDGAGQGDNPEAPQAASESVQQSPAADAGNANAPRSTGARTVAAGMVRTMGMLAALSVPGMEGASGLSLGPRMNGPPSVPDGGEGERESGSDFASDNVISPATPPAPPPDQGGSPHAEAPPEDQSSTKKE